MKTTKEYMDQMHRIGRLSAAFAIIIMIVIPTIMAITFDAFPGIGTILAGAAGLLAIFIPLTISELISYTPVLGTSIYMTLITGNVMNLKLPCAMNAIKLLGAESGTEKGDVIAAIAVSVSSIVTVITIAMGVILLVPLKPILTMPAVTTASQYILPALFGAFGLSLVSSDIGGGVIVKGRLKGAIIPALIIIGLFFVSQELVSQLQGALIIVLLPVTFFGTKWLYKKGKITVKLPE